jgi:hypothetical protein
MTRLRQPFIAARSRCFVASAAIVGLALEAAEAQSTYKNPVDFTEEALFATGVVRIGPRAAGMGGAFTAVADDATALDHNPAGLAQLVHVEVALGLRHDRERSTHGFFGNRARGEAVWTGLDHLVAAYPFPTYRGSLVVAFGMHRARTNELESVRVDRLSITGVRIEDSFRRDQEGGLWRFVGGFGVDVLRSLSFGANVAYWHGTLRDDLFRDVDETHPTEQYDFTDRQVTEATVNGVGLDFGLLGYAGRGGRIGFVVRTPVWLDIEGDGSYTLDDRLPGNPDASTLLLVDQQPRLPWSVALGGSWTAGPALLTAETRYTGWDELDLDEPPVEGTGLPAAPSDYTARLGARAGCELAWKNMPVRLRGGWAYEPVAYDLLLGRPARISRHRHTLAVGAGVLLEQLFTLDVSAEFARWTRVDRDVPDVYEERRERRVVLAGAYRY